VIRRLLPLLAAAACSLSPCRAQPGAEFAQLEAQVAAQPDDPAARRTLAQAYAAAGFVEEAAVEYLALLSPDPGATEDKAALDALLQTRMPSWLPPSVTQVKPFTLEAVTLATPIPWELLATTSFPAHEGERADRLHHWAFPRVAYGYVWEAKPRRWQLRVRVHHTSAAGSELVPGALKTTLALYAVVKAAMGFDPTGEWKTPVDVWLAEDGPAGGHSAGRSIYLYSVTTPRSPEEWLRELAHEYGHTALPGMGGFTKTDDPWADGELGELLFLKWLAAAKPTWLPWSLTAAEDLARPRREQLIASASGPLTPSRLRTADLRARDYFLGLALKVESESGPRRLAEALSRCPRGAASQFLAALTPRPQTLDPKP
jgi:hypothetical protein